jgi:Mrp family chromosome partitioning ATPase
MDKIRKALDIARRERTQFGDFGESTAAATATAATTAPAPPAATAASSVVPLRSPLNSIVYTRTRIFSPAADVLEDNRIMHPSSAETGAAAFRMLRTQVLQRMDANGWRCLAIFSPGDQDGKTTTAINLAINLANDQHHTVLLVDFDLKRPTVAARLGLAPERGVDDVLGSAAEVEDCLYHLQGFDRLVVLPARGPLSHSSEILAGPRGRELVTELHRRYTDRIVVFDLPPVLTADDALAFAPLVECGLVVAAEGRTRRADLVRTIELLSKTALVGTVLNRATDVLSGY